jgi:site-specific DNA recombinase
MSEESRLGREPIQTMQALKDIVDAGVRVFVYLEDRELALGTMNDDTMMFLRAQFAAEERRKNSQRAIDKAKQLARAGHVTGGRVFGYDNLRVDSHTERRINEREAPIVRYVFSLCAEGLGFKAIAKRLNEEGVQSPRAQCGRSQSWAPTSVREVLHRDLYRGVIPWNRTRKRNQWGAKHQAPRPPADWIDVPAPHLAIVTAEQWQAAHARISASRAIYKAQAAALVGGRPKLGTPSKYLLTGLAQCGCCGGSVYVRSSKHGKAGGERRFFYGCSSYNERGRAVCANQSTAPMGDVDNIVVEALLDEVLDASILRDAVDAAVRVLQGDTGATDRVATIEAQLAKVTAERQKLLAAVTSGQTITGLLEALQALELRSSELESAKAAIASQRPVRRIDAARMRRDLIDLSQSWRQVLADDPANARPIVSSLLKGRVTLTPAAPRQWTVSGEGSLVGLFDRLTKLQEVWRPHRDSNPGFSLERAAS